MLGRFTWRTTTKNHGPTDEKQFYNEKLGVPWKPDPVLIYFTGLVKEYREKCEEYDKSVCPKRFKGIAIPETTEQWRKVNQNARWTREMLMAKAAIKNETLTAGELEGYWIEAMEITRP